MANKDSVLAELEAKERSEQGSMNLMLSKQSQIADAMGLEDQDYERLQGPKSPFRFLELDDFAAEADKEIDERKSLKDWYFSNIDAYRSLLQSARKAAKKGHPLFLRDLVQVKLQLAKLDNMAEDAGWDFFAYPKTAYERLHKEFKLCDELTVEHRRVAIQHEHNARAAYLISLKQREKVSV